MKLLIITQKVDKDDPVLGFFHKWIEEFSARTESTSVICLEKGRNEMPSSVPVYSLGKEQGGSRLKYILNFYRFIWSLRGEYDTVFVHMNQEYVILGGLLWKILGKRIFLWRNHPSGSLLTRLAVLFSDRVFCTSPKSFTARFRKTEIMPAGIDTSQFAPLSGTETIKRSILYLGRISSIKRVHVLVDALKMLDDKGIEFKASIYGGLVEMPGEEEYYKKIRSEASHLEKKGKLSFEGAVRNEQAVLIYNRHEILVNLTPAGSFDKVVIEMMSCGRIAIASNKSFTEVFPESLRQMLLFKENDPADLAEKIEYLLALPEESKDKIGKANREAVVDSQSLTKLADMIFKK